MQTFKIEVRGTTKMDQYGVMHRFSGFIEVTGIAPPPVIQYDGHTLVLCVEHEFIDVTSIHSPVTQKVPGMVRRYYEPQDLTPEQRRVIEVERIMDMSIEEARKLQKEST
jgi:hypothetical protein